jgi:hypothetical protein
MMDELQEEMREALRVKAELREAEQAFADDPSETNFHWVEDLKLELQALPFG